MKHYLKKLFMLCLSLVFCGLISVSAQAAERTINADDEWVSGSLNDSVQYYRVSIPSAGKITYTFQSYADNGYCELLDKDWAKHYSGVGCFGSSVSPETKSNTHDMEAGTYYLKIWSYWEHNWTGDYRVKVSFTPANNNETEPNNSFDTAMPLTQNQMITGYISEDDSIDFYKFTINSAQSVEIIWTNADDIGFSVWDKDFLEVDDDDWFSNGSRTWEKFLQPGTYYIKFRKDNTGSYTVKRL